MSDSCPLAVGRQAVRFILASMVFYQAIEGRRRTRHQPNPRAGGQHAQQFLA